MWKVEIRGEHSTLERLAQLLSGDIKVTQEGEQFFVTSTIFDDTMDAGQVDAVSSELSKILSGIAAVHAESHEELTIGHVVFVRDDGTRNLFLLPGTGHFFMSTFHLDGKGTIYHTDGTTEPASESGVNAVKRAMDSAFVNATRAKAYRLRGEAKLLWSDLYRILEVIETEVPQREMRDRGWTTDNEIERFTRSANSVAVAGDHARHGKEKWAPPPNPMTLREATAFIDKLLRAWNQQ